MLPWGSFVKRLGRLGRLGFRLGLWHESEFMPKRAGRIHAAKHMPKHQHSGHSGIHASKSSQVPNFWQTLGTLWTKPSGKPTGDMDISIVNSCTVEKTRSREARFGSIALVHAQSLLMVVFLNVFDQLASTSPDFSLVFWCFLMLRAVDFPTEPARFATSKTATSTAVVSISTMRNPEVETAIFTAHQYACCAFLQCPNCFLRIRFCGFLGQVQRDVIEQQLILFFSLLSLSLSPSPSLSLTFFRFRSIVHNVCVCVQIYQT